jgi:hypothetical protein
MVIGVALIGVIGAGFIAAIVGVIITDRDGQRARASARHTPVGAPSKPVRSS